MGLIMELTCPIRGILNTNDKSKDGLHFSEEKIRIDCVIFLLSKGYPKECIKFETNVWDIGNSGRNHLRADIVVYETKASKKIHIIVETKRDTKDKEKAIENQLIPACTKQQCNYGIYFDGVSNALFTKSTNYKTEFSLVKLPNYGYNFNTTPLVWNNLIPIDNINALISIFDQLLHNIGKTKEEKYKELFKIILCKYYDEKQNEGSNKYLTFQHSNNTVKQIEKLYEDAKKFYSKLTLSKTIKISNEILIRIVILLQEYSLLKSQQDILQTLFMRFAQSTLKTELDQFYTPITIVDFIVTLLDISNMKKIIDPAGGSGDFLVGCLKKNHKISQNIYYWDSSSKAVEVAHLNMIISGDGRTNINMHDSIEKYNIDNDMFDIVITNPPFGSKTIFTGSDEVCEKYDLYNQYGYKQLGKLFIERALNLLIDGGILCIILPHGYMTNPQDDKNLRQFIVSKARIIAYISLPEGTFKGAETGVKVGILILQKDKKIPKKYNIFTDVAINIGFNYKSKKLEKIYKKNYNNGHYLLDDNNNKIILSDLDDIAKKFKNFAFDNSLVGFEKEKNNASYNYIPYNKIKSEDFVIRPEMNIPSYLDIVKQIKSKDFYTLNDCIVTNKKSINKIDNASIYSYIDITNMSNGDYSLNNKLYGWDLPNRAKLSAKKNDIFISKLKGSIDKFCMILHDETINTIITNGCYKISISDEAKRLSFYKFLFSNQYLIQMEALATGSIMLDVKEKDIKTMLFFPKLSRKELDEMKELVKYQEKFIKLKYGL